MKLYEYNDGGRAEAGYKGDTGDCVVRAIAIATKKPYQDVYKQLYEMSDKSPRLGVKKKVYHTFLEQLGWVWTPTMKIGSGCKVHLIAWELPEGRLICRLSKHLTAVIDGVVNDTHDCSRGGTRCVYGYYKKSDGWCDKCKDYCYHDYLCVDESEGGEI